MAVLFAVGFGGVVGWLAWEGRQTAAFVQSQTLPDGSVVELRAVTFGKIHRCFYGAFWQRFLRKIVPDQFVGKIGGADIRHDTVNDSLMFWVVHGRVNQNFFSERTILAVEINGRGEEGEFARWPASFRGKTDELQGVELAAFDRRGKTIGVRLYQRVGTQWKRVAEFKARNFAWGLSPTWKPEALPVTKTNGTLATKVTRLDVGRESSPPNGIRGVGPARLVFRSERGLEVAQSAFGVDHNEIRLGLRCEEILKRNPTTQWSLREAYFQDATGNRRGGVLEQALETRAGDGVATFHGVFTPHESAWKIRLGFSATAGTLSDQDQLCRFPPIPASFFNQRASTNVTLVLHGAKLQVLVRAAADTTWSGWWVELKPWPTNLTLSLLEAKVDQIPVHPIPAGEPIASFFRIFYPDTLFFQPLPLAPTATNLNLTFAIHQTQYFDFLVQPTVVETNRFLRRP